MKKESRIPDSSGRIIIRNVRIVDEHNQQTYVGLRKPIPVICSDFLDDAVQPKSSLTKKNF
jgi:hypothetical protein